MEGMRMPMVPWHMQGWTPVPASQHALSTAHGSFLKSRPPGKRVAGKRDPRAAGVWWGQRDLRLVPQGFTSFWAMSQKSIIVTPTQ